jgi:hypothetical protein
MIHENILFSWKKSLDADQKIEWNLKYLVRGPRSFMKIFWFELNEVARSRSKIWMKVSNHRNEIDEIVLLDLENLAEAEWRSEWRVVSSWNIFVKSSINVVADRSWIDEWRVLSWKLFDSNVRLMKYIDRVWNEEMT